MRVRLSPQLAAAVAAPAPQLDEADPCPRCGGPTFYDDDELGRTVTRCWRRRTCGFIALLELRRVAASYRLCRRGHVARVGGHCVECKAERNRETRKPTGGTQGQRSATFIRGNRITRVA